jgi:hypothetical protein
MRKLVLGFAVAGAAWAQTMTEFGAAAATGTVGGAAGKSVSNGLTAIFGKVDEQTKAAAKPASPKPETAPKQEAASAAAPAVPAAPGSATTPPVSSGPAPVSDTVTTPPAAGAAPKAAIKPPAKATSGTTSGQAAKSATKPASSPAIAAHATPKAASVSVPDPPPPAVSHAAISKPVQAPASKPEEEAAPIPLPPPPPRQASAEDLKAIAPGTIREEVLKLGAPASRISMIDDGHLLEIYSYMNKDTMLGSVRLSDGTVSRVEIR